MAKSHHEVAQKEIDKLKDKYGTDIPEKEMTEYRRWVMKSQQASDAMAQADADVSSAVEIFNDAGSRAAKHIKRSFITMAFMTQVGS
ncbi:hypothetical protein NKH77_23355 [Streptomyces sp. M19]